MITMQICKTALALSGARSPCLVFDFVIKKWMNLLRELELFEKVPAFRFFLDCPLEAADGERDAAEVAEGRVFDLG